MRISVRAKLVLLILIVMAILGVSVVVQVRGALLRTVGAELDKRSLSLAQDVALRVTDPLLNRNTLEVNRILRDTAANNPDIRYVFVVDRQGRLVAHTFQEGFPRDLLAVRPKPPEAPGGVMLLNSDEGKLHDAAALIMDGLVGHVRLGLSERALVATLRKVEQVHLLTVFGAGLLALAGAYLSVTALTGRVHTLVGAAKAVGNGDLTVRVSPGGADEFGTLALAFNDMIARLSRAQAAVQAKEQARTDLLQKLLSAQEEERRRISRELHDEIGQQLTGLIVGLKLLDYGSEEGRTHAAYLRGLAADTLTSVRHLSRDLRPAVLDDMGLVHALRRHIEDFGRVHGVRTELQVVGGEHGRLPAHVETTLYRVVQEALTNVARHSGARHAGVVLDLRPPVVAAIVEDDGQGFDPTRRSDGLGLAGMEERVALVGGRMTVESRLGAGTSIYIKVPVEEEEHAGSDR